MFLTDALRWYFQSCEGKLYHPETDASVMDAEDKKDTTDKEDVVEEDKEDKEDKEDTTDEDDLEITDENEEEDTEEDTKDNEDEETQDEDEEVDETDETEIVTEAKQIKAKYPEFFKEFPDVKNALFRAQAYSGLFGTIKDAEAAKARSESLGAIEQDLLVDANPDKLLDVIEQNNKEAFEKIALKVLPYLQEKNKELYFEVAALPIKQLLRGAFNKGGRNDKGELTNLGKAALLVHQYFFDNTDLNEKVKAEGVREKTETKAEKEYREKIEALNAREAKNFGDSVDNSYVKRMDNFIREGLDKDERLSAYSKNILVREILTEIKNQLQNDARYMSTLESLHKQARNSNFSNDFKSRIVSTALARAKSLVPEIRKKLVAEMLGTKKKTTSNNKDISSDRKVENKSKQHRQESRDNSKPDKSKSDLDILREA